MDEETKRHWDVRLGIVTPIVTLLGIFGGLWQFQVGEASREKEARESFSREKTLDFRRQLWLQQLDAYRTISKTAGAIVAYHEDKAKLEELNRAFLADYWGVMILVEDEEVSRAMIGFFLEIKDYQAGWSDGDRLKHRASQLVDACRRSSERTWRTITRWEDWPGGGDGGKSASNGRPVNPARDNHMVLQR